MLVEKVVQDRSELMTIINRWSDKSGKLLILEKNDTLVLKKVRNGISGFADNSFGDEMSMEEVEAEVHKLRTTE